VSTLTKADLDEAYGKLCALGAVPFRKCPECGKRRQIYGERMPCDDCRGLHLVVWESDGKEFSGIVDKHGTPVMWGGSTEWARIQQEGARRKAAGAGLPIHLR
jgi:hypothetical protein